MRDINYNRIFVVESVIDGETKTGKSLYDDLLNRNSIISSYHSVPNKAELLNVLYSIKESCKTTDTFPIIHFECHGEMNQTEDMCFGLSLANGEILTWQEWYNALLDINIQVKNTLAVTMAVCGGFWGWLTSAPTKRPAFFQMVSSEAILREGDYPERFFEFYQSLLENHSFETAFEALKRVETGYDTKYRHYTLEDIFKIVQKGYIDNDCTAEAWNRRAKESISRLKRSKYEQREKERMFVAMGKSRMKSEYKKSYNIFFMIDLYPELEEYSWIPDNLDDFKTWMD